MGDDVARGGTGRSRGRGPGLGHARLVRRPAGARRSGRRPGRGRLGLGGGRRSAGPGARPRRAPRRAVSPDDGRHPRRRVRGAEGPPQADPGRDGGVRGAGPAPGGGAAARRGALGLRRLQHAVERSHHPRGAVEHRRLAARGHAGGAVPGHERPRVRGRRPRPPDHPVDDGPRPGGGRAARGRRPAGLAAAGVVRAGQAGRGSGRLRLLHRHRLRDGAVPRRGARDRGRGPGPAGGHGALGPAGPAPLLPGARGRDRHGDRERAAQPGPRPRCPSSSPAGSASRTAGRSWPWAPSSPS